MKKLSSAERTQKGIKRLKPYVWQPKKLGEELRELVEEDIWPLLTSNEYIWQVAQVKGKDFAEIILAGFYPTSKKETT